jgi:hypothetical protein
MSNEQNEGRERDKSRDGYDTPGQDTIIRSNSDAVPSPSTRSEDRVQHPDSYIGGKVNEKPGDANPALDETIGYEEGRTDTADLLRARESAEERIPRTTGKELYADQINRAPTSDQAAGVPMEGSDPEEAIYRDREFSEPDEPSETDMLGLGGPELASEENDGN